MANELNLSYDSGAVVYALVFNASVEIWNGSAFVTPATADWADYALALTEISTTGVYAADFPALDAGNYEVDYREQLGADPAPDDDRIGGETINWTGSTEAVSAPSTWPTVTDVINFLADAGVTARSTSRFQIILDGIIAEVGQRTQRQFEPDTEDAVRYFDGNGTAQLEVDELVELTSVTVIGVQSDPGYTLANVQLVYQQERPRTLLSVGQGSLPALGPTAFPRFFPAGRQNIAVTGRWGYAATIPADLWEAVCAEAAARAGNAAIFKPEGRIEEWKDDDVSVKRNLATTAVSIEGLEPTVALGWHRQYEAAVRRYKRPVGRKLRKLIPAFI